MSYSWDFWQQFIWKIRGLLFFLWGGKGWESMGQGGDIHSSFLIFSPIWKEQLLLEHSWPLFAFQSFFAWGSGSGMSWWLRFEGEMDLYSPASLFCILAQGADCQRGVGDFYSLMQSLTWAAPTRSAPGGGLFQPRLRDCLGVCFCDVIISKDTFPKIEVTLSSLFFIRHTGAVTFQQLGCTFHINHFWNCKMFYNSWDIVFFWNVVFCLFIYHFFVLFPNLFRSWIGKKKRLLFIGAQRIPICI